jgi:DNA-binding NtrC family response regulator
VSPLRERREDIQPLALHFLSDISARTDRPVPELSGETSEVLTPHGLGFAKSSLFK